MGRRCGLDPTLLWLWRRQVATTPIRPLAWEPPYAMGPALEKAKGPKKTKKTKNKIKDKERILKATTEKQQITYKGALRLSANFLAKTL